MVDSGLVEVSVVSVTKVDVAVDPPVLVSGVDEICVVSVTDVLDNVVPGQKGFRVEILIQTLFASSSKAVIVMMH